MATKDRRPYETATTLDQAFLNECADNLCCQLEMICEIETPTGTIYVSDRNKYVGERFYEARVKFPVIERVLGEWLSNEVEFSTLRLEVNNADGEFNALMPGGADFGGWIGKQVIVKLGLREVGATYRTIFDGRVTEVGGFHRGVASFNVVARDRFDDLKVNIPPTVFTTASFPHLEGDKKGQGIPIVLGDWTTELINLAAVPGIVVNGANPTVYDTHIDNVQCWVAANDLTSLDTTAVYLKRGTGVFLMAAADIVNLSRGGAEFEVIQQGATLIDGSPYEFSSGDQFFVKCLGPSLSGARDNIVSQARWLLEEMGGLTAGAFDASWGTYQSKATPAESAIANIKARVWIQESVKLFDYVSSMLEQVRLEPYINANRILAINALHFEEWDASPSFDVNNWDVERESFEPTLDERNNFNRAQGAYGFEPIVNENARLTPWFNNAAAVTQAGRALSKVVVFPNLMTPSDVDAQLKAILRLSSAYGELVGMNLTWRALLLELGDFVAIKVNIGSSSFAGVPAMVRRVAYDPKGFKIPITVWSMQMVPFGSWSPGYAGIVGGQTATIDQE